MKTTRSRSHSVVDIVLRLTQALVLMLAPLYVLVPNNPEHALAALSQNIVVSATPAGFAPPSAPTDFTVVDMGGRIALATWSLPAGVNYTEIRMLRNEYPTSITDGELVYSGNATSYNITGLSMDTTDYRLAAFYVTIGLGPSEPQTARVGGEGLIFLGLGLFILVLTVLAFVTKQAMMHMIGVIAWIIGGVVLYNQPNDNTYIPTALLMLAIAMSIVHLAMTAMLSLAWYRGRTPRSVSYEEDKALLKQQIANRTRRPRRDPWEM